MALSPFFSSPQHLLTTSLKSLVATNPSLILDTKNNIIHRNDQIESGLDAQIAIISGGPTSYGISIASLVGQGLLYAAVVPPPDCPCPAANQIFEALNRCVEGTREVLITISRHPESVTNFRIARERVKEEKPAARLEMLVVGDDMGSISMDNATVEGGATSLPEGQDADYGKMGTITGLSIVHKITGALAARGASLSDVYKVGRLVANNVISVEGSLKIPEVSLETPQTSDYPEGQVSLTERHSLKGYLHTLLSRLLPSEQLLRPFHFNTNEPILLVNSSQLSSVELGAILSLILDILLQKYHILPVRIYTGSYSPATSSFRRSISGSMSDMTFTVTLLNVVNTDIGGPGMVELLDQSCEAVGWPGFVKKETWERGKDVIHGLFERDEHPEIQKETEEEPSEEGTELEDPRDHLEGLGEDLEREQEQEGSECRTEDESDSFEII